MVLPPARLQISRVGRAPEAAGNDVAMRRIQAPMRMFLPIDLSLCTAQALRGLALGAEGAQRGSSGPPQAPIFSRYRVLFSGMRLIRLSQPQISRTGSWPAFKTCTLTQISLTAQVSGKNTWPFSR